MNESLYNKIITSVSKVVKKSINEAYDVSIYDNMYISFDELSMLNNAGNIGDILQVNQFGEYRVKPANSVNESMFDDMDFDDDEYDVSDKLNNWKDLAICFGEGLWVYLDWIGLNKPLKWALIKGRISNTNGYENTQYILNKYKKREIKGTIWEEVQNCKYNVYIPNKKQLKIIYDVNKKYNLLKLSTDYYWSSSQYYMRSRWFYGYVVDGDGDGISDKNTEHLSVALLHF